MNNWQNALDHALDAADRGFPVFPLSCGKVPAIRSPHVNGHQCKGECGQFGHGVHDATAEPAGLRAQFDAAPHAAGYGVACGSGRAPLIGLDLDRKNGVDGVAELNRLALELRITIPPTVAVCTPSGGLHLWFTGPAGVTVSNSASKVAPGIDVRGTAGYLVGPGSRGRSGEYVVHPKLGAPTVHPIPDELLALLMPPPRPAPPSGLARAVRSPGGALVGLVKFVLDSGEGELNNRLYWAACRAHESDLDRATFTRALIDAAVVVGHPPRAAERTVDSARNAPQRTRP
ncbi:bifunctional DNA primase/polymerase [Streptomyces boninensis]|uniref:bifunctional DNA primase/polymerase n=1 Tax=Streptomyces boninensis TaxID=2039455 RepID=UPI003B20EBCE